MIEDKLSHDERLRLECVAQAVAHHTTLGGAVVRATRDQVIATAKAFETFVRDPAVLS